MSHLSPLPIGDHPQPPQRRQSRAIAIMTLLRRRSKGSNGSSGEGPDGVPEIPLFDFGGDLSLASLVKGHRLSNGSTIAAADRASKVESISRPLAFLTSNHEDKLAMSTINTNTTASPTKSSGAVPFHLPWTRNLSPPNSSDTKAVSSKVDIMASQRRKQGKAPPSSYNDFRISPSYSKAQLSAEEQRKSIEQGRKQSLKRSRQPTELNVVVAGARNTGKTSWIRTLISTCDLSKCTPEAREEALLFGVSPNEHHPTRHTDPVTPLRTNNFTVLEGLDLHPDSLIPIHMLAGNTGETAWGRGQAFHDASDGDRPMSMMPRSSVFGGSKQIQLSICDSPGIDFELEDSYEVERKTADLVRYVEDRLNKTLAEETKVRRKMRGDGHIHLVLFFIDPRFIIENAEARRKELERERYASLQDATSQRAQEKANRLAQNSPTNRRKQSHQGPRKSYSSTSLRQSAQMSGQDAGNQSSIDTSPDIGIAEMLPAAQISILSRLSRRANVLPVIAKADTLTATQLDYVRAAVQRSIAEHNIDLGTFGLPEEDEIVRPPVRNGQRKKGRGASNSVQQATEEMEELQEVKVIKIRPRKAYSSMDLHRQSDDDGYSDMGCSSRAEKRHVHSRQESVATLMGEAETAIGSPPVPSTPLSQTAPLYQSRHGGYGEDVAIDEDSIPYRVPLSIFVPEPVLLGRSMHGMTPLMTPQSDYVPPVQSMPSRSSSSLSSAHPDKYIQASGRATPEPGFNDQGSMLEEMADGPTSIEGRYAMAQQRERLLCSPHMSRMRYGQMQRGYGAPSQSRRFVREFRFGQANVLDMSQCDFALLRMCLLGSHISSLRESTAVIYEQFRSERMELRRLVLQEAGEKTKDTSKSGMGDKGQHTYSTTVSSIETHKDNKKLLDVAVPPIIPQSSLVSDELF